MQKVHTELRLTDQFCVRFVNNALLQELVIRLAGGYPSTTREARFFEQEARKRDEHMRQEVEKMVRFIPRKVQPPSDTFTNAKTLEPKPKPNTISILALGDSLTEGCV